MNYRNAAIQDIDFLVKSRLEFTYGMRGIEISSSCEKYKELESNCYRYFRQAMAGDMCDIIFAEEDETCIGMGIVFYYLSVPSSFNPEGKNAYITSLYVNPDYRKEGIGSTIVKKLIETAKKRDFLIVMLNASEMGRPMYEKLGFKDIEHGMIYDGR